MGRRAASPNGDERAFPVVPAHGVTHMHTCTRTHKHTAKTRNTGEWGVRLLGPGWQGKEGEGAVGLTVCLPPSKAWRPSHCSTCPRVSGNFRARELPRASAAEAKRMGAALVIPTKDVKMLIPSTAASLQRAFRKPKAVVLLQVPRAVRRGDNEEAREDLWGMGK